MSGFSLGIIIEGAVALLLALSIGYSIILNQRLKRLHADRDTLRQMVTDLVRATDMANSAIAGLKETAAETDLTLKARLGEAETFGIELANHVSAGQAVMDRIAEITRAARSGRDHSPAENAKRGQAALQHLTSYQEQKGNAA